eukprot:COSAG01_NODE_38945_length_483_cov_0.903646_2_plen_44_part_01
MYIYLYIPTCIYTHVYIPTYIYIGGTIRPPTAHDFIIITDPEIA